MRLAVLVSSTASAAPTHTTVHLLAAALARGAAVRVVEPWDLEIDERGRLQLRAFVLDGHPPDREALVATLRGHTAPRRTVDALSHDALLLRVNPIDTAVLAFAQLAARAGLRVLNHPDALLRTTHKSWLAALPAEVPRPRSLVTRSRASVDRFASTCPTGVILKPARACGGKGVGWVHPGDHAAIEGCFAAALAAGDGWVVAQEYLREAEAGEKRLLWLAGVGVLGGYLRERAPGDFRHNLKVGGQPAPCTVTDADRAALAALGPHLEREGVWFAGVDVIGGRIVEVNVLNPGGAHYTTLLGGVDVGERLVASLAGAGQAR